MIIYDKHTLQPLMYADLFYVFHSKPKRRKKEQEKREKNNMIFFRMGPHGKKKSHFDSNIILKYK